MFENLRYSIRLLIRKPAFTLAAIIALALGIGANTAIFSLIDATLLRPLPAVARADELVEVLSPQTTFSWPDYLDYRDQNEGFSDLAVYRIRSLSLGSDSRPEIIAGALVSANYFSTLGLSVRGRAFTSEEDFSASPVTVISHSLWQKNFDSDPSAIGKEIRLNGQSFTIVGIAPEGFKGTRVFDSPQLWIPVASFPRIATGGLARLRIDQRGWGWLSMIGRLKQGTTIEQARDAMNAIARRIKETYRSREKGDPSLSLYAATTASTGIRGREDFLRFIGLLFAVVAMALMIACSNVASLLLVRATERAREIGIRLALGASRRRIIVQLLTESVMLFLAGGAVSLLFAMWAIDFLSSIILPGDAQLRSAGISLNPAALAFALGLSFLCGVAFGLAPAFQLSKRDMVSALRDKGWGKSRLRDGFVVAQIALSMILLTGAGLFLRSVQKALDADVGFDTEKIALASVNPGLQRYDPPRARNFYNQVISQVESLPGIEAASWADIVPVSQDQAEETIEIEGYTRRDDENLLTSIAVVARRYFATMGIPLVAGRDFNDQDAQSQAGVVVINEAFARRYWKDENPIGRRVKAMGKDFTVIGVAKDSAYTEIRQKPTPFLYASLDYQPQLSQMTLIVRASVDPKSVLASLEREIHAADKDLPVFDVKTMEDRLGALLVPQRMAASLLSLFGLLALLLTMVGIYGVVAYTVSQRTREIGIRIALGAQSRDVFKIIAWRGLALALTGVSAGLAAAFALTRLTESLLFEVSATDPVTFAGISLLIAAAAMAASYIPARRATRVDPMVALRYE
ncbi:MAG: ABC transporter permease [Acidobacteriota bacterium]